MVRIVKNIVKIIEYINEWQNKNDNEFTPIPIDEHSYLVFNHKNQIYRFIFSDKYKREKCRLSIPINLMINYQHMIEQEDGFTYYLLKETNNDNNYDN